MKLDSIDLYKMDSVTVPDEYTVVLRYNGKTIEITSRIAMVACDPFINITVDGVQLMMICIESEDDKTSVANFWIDAKATENAAQIALETRQKVWYDTIAKDIFRED